MDAVMRSEAVGVNPGARWIIVGGSMGSTVAQAFLALYPDRACGFVNLDGMPHGFVSSSRQYLTSCECSASQSARSVPLQTRK